jgi:hypothetical protein
MVIAAPNSSVRILLATALLSLAMPSLCQDRTLFDLNLATGYEALAVSDYQRALKFFEEAQKSPVLQQKDRDAVNLKMLVDEIVSLTRKRKELGTIQPSVHHKAMVLYVEEIAGSYDDPGKGKVTVNQRLTEEDKKFARVRQGVVREMYEAMSDGNFTIDFEEMSVTKPLKSIRYFQGKPWPDWDYYDGALEIIRQNFDTHDTFIWCTTLIQGEAHGGTSHFPLGQGQATPPKGFIELNPRFSPNMWMHEFFHVVEDMADIRPRHGHHAENKSKFPEWTGKVDNELDYYQWQFNTTVRTKGWDKLKIKTKLANEDPGDVIEDLDTYKVVARWTPKQVTADWSVQEWKIEGEKLREGPLKVMMLYTSGWKALDIAWVGLWQNDKQLAVDEHFGFSGTKKRKIVYTLDIPENVKGTFYIKAKVKGDNGTDSNGNVLMKID